jgi:anti-sigma factor RsiW
MTTSIHENVGAYALGLLPSAEADAFEAHLATCERCGDELEELMSIALALPSAEAPPAVTPHRSKRVYALVAGVALLGAAIGGGMVLGDQLHPNSESVITQAPPDPLTVGQLKTATDPTSGVRARLAADTKGWGTNVTLELSQVTGALTCQLVAVSTDGETEVAASWRVPEAGYGTSEQPNPLVLSGGTAFAPDEVERWEVRTSTGVVLVAID